MPFGRNGRPAAAHLPAASSRGAGMGRTLVGPPRSERNRGNWGLALQVQKPFGLLLFGKFHFPKKTVAPAQDLRSWSAGGLDPASGGSRLLRPPLAYKAGTTHLPASALAPRGARSLTVRGRWAFEPYFRPKWPKMAFGALSGLLWPTLFPRLRLGRGRLHANALSKSQSDPRRQAAPFGRCGSFCGLAFLASEKPKG